MAGRPSKLNEELINNLYNEIREGLPVKYACDLYSITTQSHFNWMKKGEEDFNQGIESLYSQYFDSIKKGQAEFVNQCGKEIRSGRVGWQGMAWWLERTRNDFMPKQAIEANTDDGKVTVVLGGKVKDVKKNDDSNQ